MKNILHEVKGRLDTAENEISKIVDIIIETNQNETESKKDKGKKINRPSVGCEANTNSLIHM